MTKALGEDYMQFIGKKVSINYLNMNQLASKKPQEKVSDYNLVIPTGDNIELLFNYNYNKEQLKLFAKHYKLKITGNKNELVMRVFCYLTLSTHVIQLQKIFRGHLQRKCNKYRGPGFKNRSLCTNTMDFFTMDEISSLPYTNFFSYKDKDGFIYGFDVVSLYNLVKNHGKGLGDVTNPYNRNIITVQTITKMKSLLRLSRVLQIPIQLEIKDETEIPGEKLLELRVLSLFQNMDALGNYSVPEWFTSLNQASLWRFVRELNDIWNYRAQITNETKRNICPPNGNPFRNINLAQFFNNVELKESQKVVLEIMEKMVNSGINTDSRTLGSYYVLGCLSLVNDNAAIALPWLYQSFSYM
jgi:hypothetical protein